MLSWTSSQGRYSLGYLFSICPHTHHNLGKASGWGLYLGAIITTLQLTHGVGSKCKQTLTLDMVQLSGVLEKHNPGCCLIVSLGYVIANCALEGDPFWVIKPEDDSSLISLVLRQKDRSHCEDLPNMKNTGCLKSFTEHSRDMTRVGPVYHIAAKKSCLQVMSTSSCFQ